ncbi:hypothetical protein [Leptospira barantonii]|uniref:hypothetical protein n=1 Tax=Leptospira barantonii TaxID=2023184 RepID=UPI0014384AEB|nr:hypothetical protein [Leptospira barantonii]
MKTKLLSEFDSNQTQVSTGTLSMISRILYPASLLSFQEPETDIDFQKAANEESESDPD